MSYTKLEGSLENGCANDIRIRPCSGLHELRGTSAHLWDGVRHINEKERPM